MKPKIGDVIYADTCLYISRGEDDFVGGKATVSDTKEQISGGEKCLFVALKERPGFWTNWDQHLGPRQAELQKEFGNKKAHTSPDINTPWIEDGDTVNGETYHGPDIW